MSSKAISVKVRNTQKALDRSLFSKLPYEVREMIFTYAVVRDTPLDRSKSTTWVEMPDIVDVCELFMDESWHLFYSQNEFLYEGINSIYDYMMSSLDELLDSKLIPLGEDHLEHIRKIKIVTESCPSARSWPYGGPGWQRNYFIEDNMPAIKKFSGLEEFTLTIDWVHAPNTGDDDHMVKRMRELWEYVRDIFEEHEVGLEKLTIVSEPTKEREFFFEAGPAVKIVAVMGQRVDGYLETNRVCVLRN